MQIVYCIYAAFVIQYKQIKKTKEAITMTEYQFFGVLFFGFILLLILFALVLDFSEKYKTQRREQELRQWQHKRNKNHIEKGFEL